MRDARLGDDPREDDPADELSLVGVLRSPLFALSDSAILQLRLANPASLWQALTEDRGPRMGEPATANCQLPTADSDRIAFARDILYTLHSLRGQVTVIELLRKALELTGYLATVSGLPDGERRRVNIEKLLAAARLAGGKGLSQWSLYLEHLLRQEPRESDAPLEAQGSVRLLTVHRSKGLEFPIVVLPDLGRNPINRTDNVLLRPDGGLALKLRGPSSDWEPTSAYTLALRTEGRAERAERQRLLYVALTRTQDHLILSGTRGRGEDWLSILSVALDLDTTLQGGNGLHVITH